MALYMMYENVFIRIDIFNKNKAINKYAKWKILSVCHFNLRKLNEFSKEVGIMKIENKKMM